MELDPNPRDVLGTIRAELATLGNAADPRFVALLAAESFQIARLHRIERPLDVAGRRLKAGFERMLNGFEGLDELSELELRMMVQELFAAKASVKARNCLGWLAAEKGICDLCLTLHAGGADVSVMLEAAVIGRQGATMAELLDLRPSKTALDAALEVCMVSDWFDAAQTLFDSGAPVTRVAAAAVTLEKLKWVDLLLSWGAGPEAVLRQAAFDGNTLAITLALARGANPAAPCEGRLLSEIARHRGHGEASMLLEQRAGAAGG
jgi:hypothetical protein